MPDFKLEPDYYRLMQNGKEIGSVNLNSNAATELPKDVKEQFFPCSWFNRTDKKKLKPHIYITYIEINPKDRRKGLGRKAMQSIYEFSKEKGCGGRILLDSNVSASSFYSKLGFRCPIFKQKQFEGIYRACKEYAKHFNYTKEAFINLLHQSGCPTRTCGNFNFAGLRFFDPSKLAMLCKR